MGVSTELRGEGGADIGLLFQKAIILYTVFIYSSLETVFNTFHSVLLVAQIAVARLAQVDGNCQ